ncbi:hypothetical protein CH63R_12848 [Colletotrichum higginsianum IMI 349063]|uniref:Uncharacterized protein n=1 Tax=Colletotrichum higginsianum (strain IMI 349063) TaxID=759273 RepID=A0A1B7XVE4_COLHI|nr:hypothetical protein CH63R_12848 [Colletotrichum higginsianum IMI 349063]OBR03721.1 hypothetical protein CH63R_12848 [Colletotrichum higginsianum IMI 349063]
MQFSPPSWCDHLRGLTSKHGVGARFCCPFGTGFDLALPLAFRLDFAPVLGKLLSRNGLGHPDNVADRIPLNEFRLARGYIHLHSHLMTGRFITVE